MLFPADLRTMFDAQGARSIFLLHLIDIPATAVLSFRKKERSFLYLLYRVHGECDRRNPDPRSAVLLLH